MSIKWNSAVALCLAGYGVVAGMQSNNYGIPVLPKPGAVTVDGTLSDWDLSGRILAFADRDLSERYSASAAAMWDADYLYLSVRWRDPTPLVNGVDPRFNPNDGWKGDALQLRLKTDQVVWVTAWNFTPQQRPVLHFEYGKTPTGAGGGRTVVCSGDNMEHGAAQAFRRDSDGKGYTQELRLPWKLLFREPPALKAGDKIRLGMEFIWGDVNNPNWPMHRYADNLQPGNTSREFFWKNVAGWGDAELLASGNVPLRTYTDPTARKSGPVPIRMTLPADSRSFTLVIEDADGNRLRNLAGGFAVEEHRVATDGGKPVVEVRFDGLDDNGKLLVPGQYRVRGLAHRGLGIAYDSCFYNPGKPPWGVPDGTGAWGADHHAPGRVCRSGDRIILGWEFAEGGSGMIGLDANGRKLWGENRGAAALAADADYVYAVINSWYGGGRLCRFDAATGRPAPFLLDGKARPFELPVADLAGAHMPPALAQKRAGMTMAERSPVTAMASDGKRLVLALDRGGMVTLDAATAVMTGFTALREVTSLAFGPGGELYAIAGGRAGLVDSTGSFRELPVAGIGNAGGLSVGVNGDIAILDNGADSQVKVFDRSCKLLRTVGRRGGRSWSGKFDPQAMMKGSAVTFDAAGALWVTEHWDNPRRVSVWGGDGRLQRDFIGNSGYAGTGSWLDPEKPDFAYLGPVELQLDRRNRTNRVTRLLWVPDEAKNEAFPLLATTPHWFSNATTVRSNASGKPVQALFFYDKYRAVYLPFGDRFQPVAAIGHVGDLPESIRERLLKGENVKTGFFWNDRNFDGAIQRDELDLVPGGHGFTRSMTDWGNRIDDDMTIFTNGIYKFAPVGFAANGAPIYGAGGKKRLPLAETGDLVPVPGSNVLLCLSFKGFPKRTSGMLGVDKQSGKILWSYPSNYPSVHGSHRAPMAQPGLLIGPLKITGVADSGGEAGAVFQLRGNLGEDYLMTVDGLYVGKLLQDCRLPGDSLPSGDVAGLDLAGFSGGGEPFCGWFGRMADGRLMTTLAIARQAGTLAEITGLNEVRRLPARALTLTADELAKCESELRSRQSAETAAKPIRAGRLGTTLPVIEITQPGNPVSARVTVGYDDTRLQLSYTVRDPSPMRNAGGDYRKLFKTGDAVDLMLEPVKGRPIRLLLSEMAGKPVAVLTELRCPGAAAELGYTYHSPVMDYRVDRVELLRQAKVTLTRSAGEYTLTAEVPLRELGLSGLAGRTMPCDVGLIVSDATGTSNTARICRFNRDTNLVNDLPGEAQLTPAKWGRIEFSR